MQGLRFRILDLEIYQAWKHEIWPSSWLSLLWEANKKHPVQSLTASSLKSHFYFFFQLKHSRICFQKVKYLEKIQVIRIWCELNSSDQKNHKFPAEIPGYLEGPKKFAKSKQSKVQKIRNIWRPATRVLGLRVSRRNKAQNRWWKLTLYREKSTEKNP